MARTNVLNSLADIQDILIKQDIDGWLLYDWHGINRIAQRILGTRDHMLTRRIFYWIPSRGGPVAIVPRIDSGHIPRWPGNWMDYSSWQELRHKLAEVLKSASCVAMEYSPCAEVPSVSLVDAGTVELIQSLGKRVVSSAELILRLSCVLSPEQAAAHRKAATALTSIKDETFRFVGQSLRNNQTITERQLADFIVAQMNHRGLVRDSGPIVALGSNAGKPHYAPAQTGSQPIVRDRVLLVDMWARDPAACGIYADISWMAYTGPAPPARVEEVFRVVTDARDLAVEKLRTGTALGQVLRGCDIDEAVRDFIKEAGWGNAFYHRTGHNIGGEVHGDGTHLDNWETRDTRPLIPGLCFSIEPGIYLADFGVRSEINVLMTEDGPEVTTPAQQKLVLIG